MELGVRRLESSMSGTVAASFSGRDLELELLDPDSEQLVRLFRHPGVGWEPPSEAHRNLRVDPPAGHKAAFAVLYTGNTLPTVAIEIECGILRAAPEDRSLNNVPALHDPSASDSLHFSGFMMFV